MHLKQSSFFNNSFLLRSRFNILDFFHAETDDISQADNVLATKWAAEITDVLMIDQTFNSINLTLTFIKLIIKLSFELTFWIQLNLKLSYLHFQLNLSWVAYIFNLTWRDSTENWVNSTRFIKNSSLTLRELNIEIFSTFALSFCIIFLIESHEEETWKSFDKESWWEI